VVAFAGGSSIPALGSVTLPNLNSSAANDLHVTLSAPVTSLEALSGAFPTVTHNGAFTDWTLSGSSVSAGESAAIEWSRTAASWEVPQLTSYYWTQNGVRVGAIQRPLRFFVVGGILLPATVSLSNLTLRGVDYSDLDLTVDGNPLVVDGSGRLGLLGSTVLGTSLRPNEYYIADVIDGSTGAHLTYIAGTAPSADTPEPFTMGVAGLGLIGICVLGRRRLRRQ
jgi:hypothetical protein